MPVFRYALLLFLSFAMGLCGLDYVSTLQAQSDEKRTPSTSTSGDLDSDWRRTPDGWVQTDSWAVSSNGTDQSQATRVHPSLIAAFVILVSIGALFAFDPAIRRRRRILKSDQVLIQAWARSMHQRAASTRNRL